MDSNNKEVILVRVRQVTSRIVTHELMCARFEGENIQNGIFETEVMVPLADPYLHVDASLIIDEKCASEFELGTIYADEHGRCYRAIGKNVLTSIPTRTKEFLDPTRVIMVGKPFSEGN